MLCLFRCPALTLISLTAVWSAHQPLILPAPLCRWVVPLVWLPLIAWGLTRADAQRRAAEYSPAMLLAGLLLGGTLWQCLEYAVHRFVFHNEPTSAWGVTVRVQHETP